MSQPFILLDSMASLTGARNHDAPCDECAAIKVHLKQGNSVDESLFDHPNFNTLIYHIHTYSPYLTRLMQQWPEFFIRLCREGPDTLKTDILTPPDNIAAKSYDAVAAYLRHTKQHIAFITAIADICGMWSLEHVTRTLSELAEMVVNIALEHVLHDAHQRGEIALADTEKPSRTSGIVILGMGKLGAYELNYSSDIDLIILYEPGKLHYTGRRTLQHLMNRLAQDITSLLQDRTQDGYVFRTDLRLRPDPLSTPLAVPIDSAIRYYESVGQNWERAAMIKARQIAGDTESGNIITDFLERFIWRKHLDFAAIADISSIKRQMHTREGDSNEPEGHNVKLGLGGIREIEFFVQTQQLIRGGRDLSLRTTGTLETLHALCDLQIMTEEERDQLVEAYYWLRHIEHRLQMVDDQQTHSLPGTTDELQTLAPFLGYESLEDFSAAFNTITQNVHRIYANSMEDSLPLSSVGNLVFTGVEADPETLRTLETLGFTSAMTISDTIQNWHRGSRRATRSARARELLTELVPSILEALADTANPDTAFFRFDEFLSNLPSGVQIFSLFTANPELLKLLATILGSAPALGTIISHHPSLFDAVLHGDFFTPLSNKKALREQLRTALKQANDYEDVMHIVRTFKNEQRFAAGVHMLKQLASPQRVGIFLSDLADGIIAEIFEATCTEFTQQYGTIENGTLAIVAMGKLGGVELTFNSDLDLMFIYDAPDTNVMSNGNKSIDARSYYHRLTQRVMTALTSRTKEGQLYDVDTRLRPNGADGPIASSKESFDRYFTHSAWTFEHMALTRARIVYSSTQHYETELRNIINKQLSKPRDATALIDDIIDMREKVNQSYYSDNPWNIKYVRGGLMDLDFICQYLVLRHANAHSDIITESSYDFLSLAKTHQLLPGDQADELIEAKHFLNDMLSFLRLCGDIHSIQHAMPTGMKNLLLQQFDEKDYDSLLARLVQTQSCVFHHFEKMNEM